MPAVRWLYDMREGRGQGGPMRGASAIGADDGELQDCR